MSTIQATDADFRVCSVSLDELLQLQAHAEERGLSARWSSANALSSQVRDSPILLLTFLRQGRPVMHAYRCLALFDAASPRNGTSITTFDIAPDRLAALPRLDRDSDVRAALAQLFGSVHRARDITAKT